MRRVDVGGVLLAALEAAMEGGWLLVVYAGFEVGLMRHPAALGPVEFTLAAALGIWIARRPRPWPRAAALAALAGVAVVGWLADPAVPEALAAGTPLAALAAHPGGLLLGAAVIRGGRHRDPLDDVEISADLLRYVTPALLVPWLVGAIIPDAALRMEFVSVAWSGTLLFVASGFAALGLGRLRLLGLSADPRDPTGRTWFLVTAAVPCALVALGVPLAFWFGLRPEDLAEAIARPGVLLFSILALLIAPPIVAGGVIGSLLGTGSGAAANQGAGHAGGFPAGPVDSGQLVTLATILLIVVGLMAVVVLRWLRPPQEPVAPILRIVEQRALVRPARRPRGPLRRPRVPPLVPHDAVTAYLATLAALDVEPQLARAPAETPAAHARRLAQAGDDPPPGRQRRLAADYQLARYGRRALTPRETTRALSSSRLRREPRRLD
ncbi:MAG: DUF4129 domain-containing protein [Candidatus Limnocylindrales bacterium]